MIQTTLLKKVVGNYRIAGSDAVTDPVLLNIAQKYQEQIGRKISAISPRDLPKRFTGTEDVLETTKYDGEGVFVYFEKSDSPTEEKPEIFLFNAYSGRVRVGLPCSEILAEQLRAKNVTRGLFRAEVYLPKTAGKRRPGTHDVTHVSFNGTPEEVGSLKLGIIDIVMLDGDDWRVYQSRFLMIWNQMEELFGTDTKRPFHRVEGKVIPETQVVAEFDRLIAQGEEGAVIRRLNRPEAVKAKPKVSIDAAVIGYVEGEFEGQYGVRSLLVALTYKEEGHTRFFHAFSRVYSGMTDKVANDLLPTLQARKVDAPLNMTDSEGRIIHFVKPGPIVQIEGEEIVVNKNDKPVTSQLFDWDGTKWSFIKVTAIPRLSFPTYVGPRDDKRLQDGGARIEQAVADAVLDNKPASQTAESKIVSRRVWTKTLKGETMVRKLTIVQNPESETRIPWVIVAVDYSPKRADPLKVDTYFAKSEDRMKEIETSLSEAKKGWEEVGKPAATAA